VLVPKFREPGETWRIAGDGGGGGGTWSDNETAAVPPFDVTWTEL
jgi:hypothetical protein